MRERGSRLDSVTLIVLNLLSHNYDDKMYAK